LSQCHADGGGSHDEAHGAEAMLIELVDFLVRSEHERLNIVSTTIFLFEVVCQ
jgi:hypothetical protein